MKSTLVFLLIFFLALSSKAQEVKSLSRTSKSLDIGGKVFNKITGDPITNLQLMELLKEKPGLQMEILYNQYGDLEKCLYDPTAPFKEYPRDPTKRPMIGQSFPDFVFKTIEGKEVQSNDLIGNWVLIHFTPLAQFVQKERWERLASDLQIARENFQISSFGVFAYDDDLIDLVGEFQTDIKLVNNGNGFFSRYHIIENPTTVLINPEGIIVNYFYESDPIDFLPLLKKN